MHVGSWAMELRWDRLASNTGGARGHAHGARVLSPPYEGRLREDGRDCLRLGDFANHAKLPPAVGTHTQFDTENPIVPSHPSHRRTRGLGGVVALRSARAGGLPGHDEVTVSGIGREQAVISHEMGRWPRHLGKASASCSRPSPTSM